MNQPVSSQGPLRQTFYRTVVVLLTVFGGYLVYKLGETLLLLFVAIIFASAIRPAVEWLVGRGVRRGVAALLVYGLALITLLALIIFSIPPLVSLTIRMLSEGMLVAQARAAVADVFLFAWRQFNVILPIVQLPDQLTALIAEVDTTAREQALPLARETLGALGQVFLAIVMGFYWLTSRAAMLDLLFRISPSRQREQISDVWNDIEKTLGAYVRGQVTLMAVVGAATLAGLLVLRVPNAGALAVLAGLTEIIPLVGPFIGLVPAVLVALTVSPTTALLVALLYLVIQQLESNVLVPKVMQQNVELNPLVIILALVAGSQIGGFVGALLAIPVAGALTVIARHLLINPAIQSAAPVRQADGAILISGDPLPPAMPPAAAPDNGPRSK